MRDMSRWQQFVFTMMSTQLRQRIGLAGNFFRGRRRHKIKGWQKTAKHEGRR